MADPPFEKLQPEYAQLWKDMQIRPEKLPAVKAAANRIASHKATYQAVTAAIGVPWVFVGIIHSLEADNNMGRHLHNGNPLGERTKDVPKGRPVAGDPPFDWDESAIDALKLKNLDVFKEWPLERMAYEFERYNGWGYRNVGGGVKSAYLWSFTNHHLRGKFIRDHVFDPDAPSNQVGAMALLKHFMDSGIEIAGGALTVEVKTKPLTSDLFMPLGPFELLPTRDAPQSDDPAIVVTEIEQCKKIREHGAIWEIDVLGPDGTVKSHGFAHGSFFRPLVPIEAVDIDSFARLCLTFARLRETSAHHLVAVADLETGIRNVAAVSGDGAGPFLIGAADWASAVAGGAMGITVAERLDPYSQPAVAAKMTVDATAALKAAIPDRLPTSAELYIAHLIGAAKVVAVLSNRARPLKDALIQVLGQAQADTLKAVRPWLFEGNASVSDALTTIARKMDFGYQRADQMFVRVEPDFEVATASGFAGRVRDMAVSEWGFFGKQTDNLNGVTVSRGHRENEARVPAGSGENWFDRVGKYWRSVGKNLDGRDTTEPWSAAFISYVLKECNVANKFRGSARHSHYISQAIRDFSDKADVAYWCQRLNECNPAVGDVVCWAREGGVDYDNQKGGEYKGHCDFVVEVSPTEVQVIGGNVGQSVTKRPLALDGNGHLKPVNRSGERLFAIMQNQIK